MLFSPHSLPPSSIIFDLGDVLFETNSLQCMRTIGPLHMLTYTLRGKNPFLCYLKLLDFLDTLEIYREPFLALDHRGYRIPQIMCNWLKGTLSGKEVLQQIYGQLHAVERWWEQKIIAGVAHTIFIPDNFASNRTLVPAGARFVKACKEAGHQLYILSNWDPESFERLQKQYASFFDLFEGIMISGTVGVLKPDHTIFDHFFTQYSLAKQECIFIDDVLENVSAAQKYGITSIHYKKKVGFAFDFSAQWHSSIRFAPLQRTRLLSTRGE